MKIWDVEPKGALSRAGGSYKIDIEPEAQITKGSVTGPQARRMDIMADKIRVGIIGLGRAGWGMHCKEIDRFKDFFTITGCFDVLPERMAKMSERYPSCRSHASAEEFYAAADIDLVAVAMRSPEHVAAAIAALEAGKYVFLEKPLALSNDEVLELKAAAEKHPGKLFCRHNRRLEAAYLHVREIIASGKLGEIFEIKLCRHSYQRRNDWQSLKSCGGGQLNNWGPHLIDHALQFLESPVESVWCDMKLVAASGDAEDHFKAIIRGENGRIIDVEVSGGVALASPVYAVYGKLGTLIAHNEKEFKLKYLDVAKCSAPPQATDDTPPAEGGFGSADGLVWIEESIPVAPSSGDSVSDLYKYIYLNIREGQPFPVKNEEAFEVVRVTEMLRKSSKF
jgi:scyllo-inositol 2-dehydrogenase (NADP+)